MLTNRQKTLLVVSLALVSGCATAPDVLPFRTAKNANVIGRQLSLARLSERHDQQATAEKIYQQILAEDADNPQALHRMGVIAAREERLDEAMDLFQRAKQVDPDNAELMADLGYAYFLQDELDQAEVELRASIEADPQLPAAHNNLGLVLAQKGKWDESLREFRMAVDDAEAYANLAFMQSQMGELELAEQNFHKALDLDNSLRSAAEGLVQLDRTFEVHEQRLLAQKNQQATPPTNDTAASDVIQVSSVAESTPVSTAQAIPVAVESNVPVVRRSAVQSSTPSPATSTMPQSSAQPVTRPSPAPVVTELPVQATEYPSTNLPQAEYFDAELGSAAQPISEQTSSNDEARMLQPTRVEMPQMTRESNTSLAPMSVNSQPSGPTVKMSPPMLGSGSSRANRPQHEAALQPSQAEEASQTPATQSDTTSFSFSG